MSGISRTHASLTHKCEALGLTVGVLGDVERFRHKDEFLGDDFDKPLGIYAVLRDGSEMYLGKNLGSALKALDQYANEIPRAPRKPVKPNKAHESLTPAELQTKATQQRRRVHG